MGRRWRETLEWFGFSPSPPAATFDSAPRPIDQVISAAFGSGSSPHVGRTEALSVPAVQRGRNLICSISTLPLVQRGPDRRVVRSPLLEQIDPHVANVVTLAQTLEDLLFEGTSWWRVTAFGWNDFPTAAMHLDFSSVSVDPPKDRSPAPLPSGIDPREGVVWVDGKPVPFAEMIRFDSPNPAVLQVGGRAIRRAILLDLAAQMYADDPRPLDYFTPAEGAVEAEDDDVKDILSKWRAARKKRSTAWVPRSMNYNSVDAPSPAELQLVELQKQAAIEIANALGVDPEDLGVSTTSRTYANAVDRRRDRINDVLSPYMKAITDRLSMGDVTRRGYSVLFDLDDYLRANPTERWGTYKVAKEMGAITIDEIRQEEGLPSLPAGAVDPPAPAPAGASPMPVDASRPAAVTFDAPGGLQFADVEVTGFSVDLTSRTIEGLALPYGRDKIGRKFGMKFRFQEGALQWSDVSRVKLRREHVKGIGHAVTLTDTPAGLRVKFKVARGADGDEALLLAEDKVLDGLSVGVDFDLATDTVPDPNDSSVLLVRRADLREVSLTDQPNFDDARVTKVAASRTEGDTVPETTTEPVPAPAAPAVVPGPVTFSADQVSTIVADAIARLAEQNEPEQRQTVNPTRLTASTSVTEAAPYRFDRKGNLHAGSHDFGADVISGLRDNDKAAHDRALSFVQAQFDVVTTDVNELNPTRNRPDMFVDQRDFRYPVWNAINKGTLSDITPFTFPKFSSAAGLVGAHTEGTEPSSGTYVATNATVTPTALSGKAKISRETWDQGGSPMISNLIWRQMQKGWFEALEAAAVAVLDAASPTGITLTTAAADDVLDQELTAAFAALQFVRGGFSMDNMFTQIDLYKKLVAATDANGRRLYPAIGPQNALGTVSNRFGSLDINGVTALPAWALAATGTVAASSYLFDSESVHGWASAPQRLTIDQTEVANVYIGIWGYKATVISDLDGVRELIYDPV